MDQKKYYVICPSSVVTGGPDALHQMVYYLRKCGKDAEIAYVPFDSYDVPIPDEYKFNSVEEQKKQICEKIHYCLENYPNIIGEFENYKNTVLNLESNFINSINRVFNK